MLNTKNHIYIYFVVLLSFSLSVFWVNTVQAHIVEVNSSGNTLNLTVNNTSSNFDLPGVTVSVTSSPSWITMGSAPPSQDIPKSGNKTFSFTFSVGAGADECDEPTGSIEFKIESTSGDSTTKSIPIETKLDDTTPPIITLSGASNGATYFMPVSLTVSYSVTDDKDPNPQITFASHPSGTVFDSEGSYTVTVKAKDCADNEATETLSFRIARRPRPDDNYNISDGTPSPIHSDPFAEIGILNRGLIGSLCSILTNLGETYTVIDLPIDAAELQSHPILIIPSGGLTGLEDSQSTKDALEEYVQNGGVIFSLSQERGYLFNVLPDEWQGAGYLEEDGCLTWAGGIENQHVIFSGQGSVYINANADGYFTGWPQDGTVLVRRTKNALPCLIEYHLGEGIILGSTLYSDYGYLSGQLNLAEKRLIRDIVSWGKDADTPINAYNIGDLVEETATVMNQFGEEDAYSVTYAVYDPDKNEVYTYEETLAEVLPSGQYTELEFTYQLPDTDCPLGIYWIKYTLKDALGDAIQQELPTGRFAVKKDIGTVDISKDINVVVKTTQSFYPIGGTGSFQITVYNDKSEDTAVRVRYGTNFHDPRYSRYGDVYLEKIIPAEGSEVFTVDVENLARGDYFSAGVFDQNNRMLAFSQEKFFVFYPSIEADISTDKATYLPGEAGTITYSLVNVKETDYTVTANIRMLDKVGNKILEDSRSLLLHAQETITDSINFTAPSIGGPYVVQIEAISFGAQLGSASCHFRVITGDFLTITSDYPDRWVIGANNTISFEVKNISQSTLPEGKIKSALFDPDNEIVWTDEEQFFDLAADEITTVDFLILLTEGKFGTYRLKCEFSYLGNLYEYYADFSNQVVFDLSFDKISYKMREDMLLSLDITNNGVFEQDITVNIDIPTFSYADATDVYLTTTTTVPYTITVPDTVSSGIHNLSVSLILANQLAKGYSFGIPPSRLVLGIDKSSYNAGETGSIGVQNIGGVDTDFEIDIKLYDMVGDLINEVNTTSWVQADSSQGIGFSIPSSAATGDYLVQTECKNILKANEVSTLSELIQVSGISADLNIETDKDVYFSSDFKNILSDIVNTSGKEISGAVLRLRIYAQTECEAPAPPEGEGGFEGGGEGPYIYPMVPDQFLCSDTEPYTFNLHPYENGAEGEFVDPKVLMVVDTDSWNTGYQNKKVLDILGIPYTSINSSQLSATDLYEYTHILIPSDQGQSMYNNLDANMDRITEWVEAGGSFQFNACDVGWQSGYWANGPGGLTHVRGVYRQQNYIQAPDHPILEGMSNSDFYGWNSVSHGYFTNVPENAQVLLSLNANGSQPTLIEFTLGNGHVIASQNTLEWTNAGRNCPRCNPDILDNIAKYMFQIGFDTLKWSAGDVDSSLMNIVINDATDVMQITPVEGAFGADQVLLTLTDHNGLTDTQWINVAVSPYQPAGNLLWEEEISLDLINDYDLSTSFDISEYNLTGKFYAEGTFISDISQVMARDIESFYIIDSELSLKMETDKKIYKPGETINILAEVTNNAAIGETGLTLALSRDGSDFYTQIFDLASGETKIFTTQLTANTSFLLEGEVKDVRMLDHISVESPQVVMSVSGPDVVGFEDFELLVMLENTGNTEAVLNLNFAGETHAVTLHVNQSASFKRTFNITENTGYSITLSGDVWLTETKTVTFGASADITLSMQPVYPEGTVDIPYGVVNTGSTEFGFTIDFTLTDASTGQQMATIAQSLYLPISGSVSDSLVFSDLTEGAYILSYNSPLPSGSVDFSVAMFNQAIIENMVVGNALTADGKLPITATVRNIGANNFIGNLSLDTGFYTASPVLELDVDQTADMTIDVPLNISSGNYEAIVQVLYNRAPISEANSVFTLMPEFTVTSVPADPVFMAGDFADITLTIQNDGLIGGMVEVALTGGDMIDTVQAKWLPGEGQEDFSFSFYVFEDLVADWHEAIITLTNLESGVAQEIALAYYVEGYNLEVAALTDKPCYSEGETAHVTLKVSNNNATGVEFEALVSFNDFYELEPFFLGGKPVLENVDVTTTPGDLMLTKTTAFEEADMGKYDSNHLTLTGGGYAYRSYGWCYDQNGDIWAYRWSSGPLSKYNGETGAWIKNVSVSYSSLIQIAVDKDGRMYGGNYGGNQIYVFNPETGSSIATRYTPNGGYLGGVFWDGEYLWFGERLGTGNKYYRVDVTDGGWNIINTFTSNFTGYGYGMGVVGNRLLISNSTSDSFHYHEDLNFDNNTMSPTYKTTPNQGWGDYYSSFNYNNQYLQRKGYYSYTIRNYRAFREAYASSGTLMSSVQDVGLSENAALSWDATLPAGTSLAVETRTGNTQNPDNTWSDWSIQNNGEVITSPAAKYLQYRITLSTGDDSVTPILHEVVLDIPNQGNSIIHSLQEDFEKMPVSVEYDVPINFTGQKLFYAVYSKSGWGVYLNSMYICESEGDLTLYTDKQVYNAGEVVTVYVYPYDTGILDISAPEYDNTFNIQDIDPFDFQFTLPNEMTTGTYSIDGEFVNNTYSCNFDVMGYDVFIEKTTLDKGGYYPDDPMFVSLDVHSNQQITGVTLEGWIYSEGQDYDCFESTNMTLDEGTTSFEFQETMLSDNGGFAELIVVLFKEKDGDPYGIFLTADSKAFDVITNEAPIISITSPLGGEVWSQTQDITWSASDPDGDPLGIDIEYSADNGQNWLILAAGEANDGAYSWDTTSVADRTNYLIKVTASDGELSSSDQSADVFTIQNAVPGDLDFDLGVDVVDFQIFNGTFGKCEGSEGYLAIADYDNDNCITFVDYQIWYGYYLDYINP